MTQATFLLHPIIAKCVVYLILSEDTQKRNWVKYNTISLVKGFAYKYTHSAVKVNMFNISLRGKFHRKQASSLAQSGCQIHNFLHCLKRRCR